jgi:hypothetical protein
MPSDTRRRLEALFEPEVQRLEALLGREIESWGRTAVADSTIPTNGGAAR